jgi:hypothetical protein
MGIVDLASASTAKVPPAQQKLWVSGEGGLKQLLNPLELALSRRSSLVTPGDVDKDVVLYPDPVRILVRRGLWSGVGPAATGRALYQLGAAGIALPDSDTAPGVEAASATIGGGPAGLQLMLVDRVGETAVLDLRALGCVLWMVFTGTADVYNELEGNIGDESFVPLLVHTKEAPLEAQEHIYRTVSAGPDAEVSKKLATLQRFVASYTPAPPGIDRILEAAARSFARWASGRQDIAPIGRKGPRTVIYKLPIGLEIKLARDARAQLMQA